MSDFFDLILLDDSKYKEFDVEEIINELRIYISSKPSDFGYKLDSILANDSDFKDIFAKRFNDLMKSDLYDFFDNTMFINYKYFSRLNDLKYFQEAYLIFIEKAYNNDKRTFQTDINELVDAPTSIGYQVLNGSNSIRDKIETGKLSCNKFYSISSEEEKKNFLHYALKDYFENGFKHGKILDIYKDDINQIGIEKFIPNMSYLASRLKLSIVPKEKDNYYNAFSFKYKYFKEAFDISKINFDFYIDDDDTYSNLKLTRALNNFKTLKELANDFLDIDKIDKLKIAYLITYISPYTEHIYDEDDNFIRIIANIDDLPLKKVLDKKDINFNALNPRTKEEEEFELKNLLFLIKRDFGKSKLDFEIDNSKFEKLTNDFLETNSLFEIIKIVYHLDLGKNDYQNYLKYRFADEITELENKFISENNMEINFFNIFNKVENEDLKFTRKKNRF